MTPLTPKMVTLLRHVADGWTVFFVPHAGLRIESPQGKVETVAPAVMRGLIGRGLVERTGRPGNYQYAATAAGREIVDGLG